MITIGYYGKLPQRGDFISANLPQTFIKPWDDWAQSLVMACKNSEPVATADLWFRLPAYRFLLSSRIAGENGWIGLLLPSCDSVGRLFPFCVVSAIDPKQSPLLAFQLHQDFFGRIEALCTEIYSNSTKLETLADRLATIDPGDSESTYVEAQTSHNQSSDERQTIALRTGNDPTSSTFWSTAAHVLLDSSWSAYSIWSRSPIHDLPPETILCEGLPSNATCESFFTADFRTDNASLYQATQDTETSRAINPLTRNLSKHSRPPTDEASLQNRTVPIHRGETDNPEREADVLEFDDTPPPAAPWDN
ncbi:type VI secretion-associated protein [Chromatiales bacterium (ex Bugula neritina AB1)]|nr:type VI secretion-associated protein [Chromatiales bacterium (ex Bugula neritina AB1)]